MDTAETERATGSIQGYFGGLSRNTFLLAVVGTAKPVNKPDKRSAARLDVKQRWFQPKRC